MVAYKRCRRRSVKQVQTSAIGPPFLTQNVCIAFKHLHIYEDLESYARNTNLFCNLISYCVLLLTAGLSIIFLTIKLYFLSGC